MRFQAETDPILAHHLANSSRNARYTYKSIQNELIAVVGKAIQNEVIDEVKEAKFYSVIADEVTDAANRELSLVLKYVVDDGIKEMFLNFIEVERITGRDLGMAVLNRLKTHGISLTN